MSKRIKSYLAVILSAALMLSVFPFSVYAEDTAIDVEFTGYNVAISESDVGEGKATAGVDYTAVVTADEGYTVLYFEVSVLRNGENQTLDYNFNNETGELNVSGSQLLSGDNLSIKVVAAREFDYENDVKKADTLPFSQELTFSPTDIFNETEYSTVFYEVSMNDGESLYAECYDETSDETDIILSVYSCDENGQLNELDIYDDDTLGYGERMLFTSEEAGTYLLAFMCYDEYIGSSAIVNLSFIESKNVLPDFTAETVPLPEEGALWCWDAGSATLTLKDGFSTVNVLGGGMILPENAKIKVEGNASVYANEEAIYAYGALDIELAEGADFLIESVMGDGVEIEKGNLTVTGTVDSEGNKSALTVVNAEDDGLNVLSDGDIEIENCIVSVTGSSEGILARNGSVRMSDSDITLNCKAEGIYSYYYEYDETLGQEIIPSEDERNSVEAVNCILNLTAEYAPLRVDYGDIILTDCESTLTTNTCEGMYLHGSGGVKVSGGRLMIIGAEYGIGLQSGEIVLDDVSIFMKVPAGEILIGAVEEEYDVSIAGNLKILSYNAPVYIGEWSDDFMQDGVVSIPDGNGGYAAAYAIMSVFDGDVSENAVLGVDNEYTQGDIIRFSAVTDAEEPDYPVLGNTRWVARKWEVSGTELSGSFDSGEITIDTSDLEPGTYTMKVEFFKQKYGGNYWSAVYSSPEEPVKDIKEIEFTVKAVEITTPDDTESDAVTTPDDTESDAVTTPDDTESDAVPAPDDTESGTVPDPDDTESGTVTVPDDTESGTATTPDDTDNDSITDEEANPDTGYTVQGTAVSVLLFAAGTAISGVVLYEKRRKQR